MAPELMVPQEFGKDNPVPTLQTDIYAFGLVIFQVFGQDRSYWLFLFILLQVLTGGVPFLGVPPPALVYSVVHDGKRPGKPENAPALGFSDSLWSFTQRCWDGEMGLRPDVEEVVKHLGEAAVSWDGSMPPCAKAEDVVSGSEGMSDSTKFGEFEILIPHSKTLSSNGPDGLFHSSPDVAPEGFIGSQTTVGSFSPLNELSTQAVYQPQWEEVTNATNKAKAVRALAKIVLDKHGRAFALCLGLEAAKLCVETLDYVSRDLRFPLPPSQTVSSGHRRVSSQIRREGRFLPRVEKACGASRAIARTHEDNRKDQGSG